LKKTNICVIGAGAWGVNHISSLLSLGVNVSCVDINKTKEKEIKKLFPHVNFFSSVSDTFEFGFDGYIVSTPPSTHCELAKIILSMRKPVLVEKPLALSFSEAKEIKSALIKNNGKLMVGHLLLFHPAIIKIKEMIKKNEIGKIQYVYSNRLNLGKVRKEENVFWSFAPHDVAVILRLAGRLPESVQCSGGEFLPSGLADVTLSSLRFSDNLRAHIFVSWLNPFKEQKLVVTGAERMAVFDDTSSERLLLYDQRVDFEKDLPILKKGGANSIPLPDLEPLRAECEHFVDCIKQREKPLTDGESGLRVLQVLEACQESLENDGRRIFLNG